MIVVAAAITRGGRVLAAHRARPPLGWEFPGGKVEPGEDEPIALARECREELGVDVAVGPRLGEANDGAIRLVLYAATTAGDPITGTDHDELRWLGPNQLSDVTWLPADVALLPAIAQHQRRSEPDRDLGTNG